MLTPSDRKNIKEFEKLNANHQRVFKHRLKIKCVSAIKDMLFVLANYEKIDIRPDKFVDIVGLVEIIERYEELCLLQNM